MDPQLINKKELLKEIDECIMKLKEIDDYSILVSDSEFRLKIKKLEDINNKLAKHDNEISKFFFKNIKNWYNTVSDFLFVYLLMAFVGIGVLLGIVGKYMTRAGYYNSPSNSYVDNVFYFFFVLNGLIGIFLYIEYYRTKNQLNIPQTLLRYVIGLKKLHKVISKIDEKELYRILK